MSNFNIFCPVGETLYKCNVGYELLASPALFRISQKVRGAVNKVLMGPLLALSAQGLKSVPTYMNRFFLGSRMTPCTFSELLNHHFGIKTLKPTTGLFLTFSDISSV